MADATKARRVPRETDAVRMRLYGSQTHCAVENCDTRVVRIDRRGHISSQVQVAHIEGAAPNGPRSRSLEAYADPAQIEELRSFENLILVCRQHHAEIDANPDSYPADTLKAWKAAIVGDLSVDIDRAVQAAAAAAQTRRAARRKTWATGIGFVVSAALVAVTLLQLLGYVSVWAIMLRALVFGLLALVVFKTLFRPERGLLTLRNERIVGGTASLALAGGLLWAVLGAPEPPDRRFDDVEATDLVVALSPLETSSGDAGEFERILRSRIEQAVVANVEDEGVSVVSTDVALTDAEVSGWVDRQPRHIDIVINGSVTDSGIADSFLVTWRIHANTRSQWSILPIAFSEGFGQPEQLLSIEQVEAEQLDAPLSALANAVAGLADLAASNPAEAREHFDQTAASFDADAIPPLVRALQGFAIIEHASQTGVRDEVRTAGELLSAASAETTPGSKLQELLESTELSLRYLDLLAGAPVWALGPCQPEHPAWLTGVPIDDVEALRDELSTVADRASSGSLLEANARSLLGRVDFLRALLGGGDEAASSSRAWFEMVVEDYSGGSGLDLWVSDAYSFLSAFQLAEGEDLEAILSLQLAQEDTPVYYRATAIAEIGHVFECRFIDSPVEREAAIAASCYYKFAIALDDEIAIEPVRRQLVESCPYRVGTVSALCVFDALARSEESHNEAAAEAAGQLIRSRLPADESEYCVADV